MNIFEKYKYLNSQENKDFLSETIDKKFKTHPAIYSIDPSDLNVALNINPDEKQSRLDKKEEYLRNRNLNNFNIKTDKYSSINEKIFN